jgi:hypothetical protein
MELTRKAGLRKNKNLHINVDTLVLWLGVILIFLPKINIISVAGQTAGLRIDDLILGFIFIYACRRQINFSNLSPIETTFLAMVGFWILSNVFNMLSYHQSNLLYSLRYIEYFLFFYVGILFARRYNIDTFLLYFVGINGLVMVLQLSGLMGGFSSIGAVSDVGGRAIGLTGGPWEIGALLNFSFAIFAMNLRATKKNAYVFLFYFVTFILILFTGSRMSLLAHLVMLIMYLYKIFANKFLFLVYLGLLSVMVLGIFIAFSATVSERSQNTFSVSNLEAFVDAYKSVALKSNFNGFPDFDIDESADLSWLMRVYKWSYAIKSWLSIPIFWLLGVGPGTWGTALDGGVLRLLTETGLIGFSLFLVFIKKVINLEYCLLPVMIALFINMLMIDIHISYKSMAFIFFAVGYFYNLSASRQDVKNSMTNPS